MNSRGIYIESASQMVHEAKRLGFVFVEVAVAQEYLLNHLFQPEDRLHFEAARVPGVMMVKHIPNNGGRI